MVGGLPARLASIMAQEDPWADALSCLAQAVGAEIGVALECGAPPRRRGSFGPLPPSTGHASDEATLVETLQRAGLATWTRTFRVERAPDLAVGLATRRSDGFTDDERAVLEAVAPLIELRLGSHAAALALDAERQNRLKLEARLVEIERQSTIGTVASAVAHDLSAPISALLMEVGEMRERIQYLAGLIGDNSPILKNVLEDLRGLVDHCTDSTERARQLLIDFRLAAHPTPATQRIYGVAVNVGEALRSCVRLVAPLARDKVRIDLVVEADLPQIPGTRRRLEQAFTNVLVNAIHAAQVREGFAGIVEAQVRRKGEDIVVEIHDNGPGIPAEVKPRIFEPFFTTKAPDQGTGLGLPIARDAVEAHGGTLEVESERGRGATFRMRLPIVAVPARANPTTVRPRVLVVDDDDGVARALERILRSDYDVTVARSGEQALDLLGGGHAFDAMLVDIAMPGIDGPELYERIRTRWPGLEKKIVFATGGAFTAASRAFLARVPNSRFEKPITREELRPIVASVVEAA
jgi:signal transduction histidine kinase/CheY-like chemotaxis protein